MDQFLLILVSGLASGAVYGLMGLGLVIIYRATDVVNFALASLATVGLYAALTLYEKGLPLLVTAAVAIVVTAAVGLVARETVIRPLAQGELLSALVMTMGVSLIAESVISTIWDDQPRLFPSLVDGSVSIGGSAIPTQSLLTIGVAAVAMALVAYLFGRTTIGSAMRAVAESADTAQILGLGSQRIARIAWALGLGLAALAAFLYAPRAGLVPTVLSAPLFRAFAGIFLGGLTSMYGAVVGGLTVGVLDNLAAGYVSAGYRDTFVFSFTILVLLIRPQGLFGVRTFQRV
ncbi:MULTISPECIES: branched-chain amino acid ABC transporter permease [unclassified Streptomyces]|uniref:branched-chain amino acid ABC transporter permease n=1 Tax=unclassified Streptomyces TaxID=2593676 RepID=UPI002253CECC|nr:MULTISPECIES: branched-chain amino acid ABC transporter permease [unclassified Streptomyces]MCX5443334.1 branched-chain amino acid ABC transporter permease [Streptomyces sp. NBC_00063]WSE12301.1 branched-chain amino acid ABC transporter permease [Streptomyces sp. NBC_01397]WSE19328.1 branched-chain amino acid ABC transporter permease [Streptomyces sp. NBC_01397]WUB98741.1 branched-chain amino acid ABC transporter permease [Streptomyces sp. NBC_00569]